MTDPDLTPPTEVECAQLMGAVAVEPRMHSIARRLLFERDRLLDWKASAMAVEREWDPQAIAKMLGARLGQSCRAVVAERVPQLMRVNARQAEMIREDHARFSQHAQERYLILGALDTLGTALADHSHVWTEGERTIYEQACALCGAPKPKSEEE
jgi:hypothetical protein